MTRTLVHRTFVLIALGMLGLACEKAASADGTDAAGGTSGTLDTGITTTLDGGTADSGGSATGADNGSVITPDAPLALDTTVPDAPPADLTPITPETTLDVSTAEVSTADIGDAESPTEVTPTDAGGAPDVSATDTGDQDAATAPTVKCGGDAPAFPTFSKTCAKATDCFPAFHQVNCCGTRVAVGLATADKAAFDAAEATCEAQYPKCKCATQPTLAEDGFLAMDGEGTVGVRCDEGLCSTFVTTAKLDCAQSSGKPQPFKLCQANKDCTYVLHTVDCCGSQQAVGLTKVAKLGFEKAEAICGPKMAICDCAPKPVVAEDGVSAGEGLIAVQCEAGACMSYIKQ